MKRLLLCLALFLAPATAYAGLPTYTGNITVPATAKLTLSGAGSNLCLLTNSTSNVVTAVCPTGTAAFVAGSNITITGSGPYTIACPNCFQTTGGTVSGATTFSANATFGANLTMSNTAPNLFIGVANTPITNAIDIANASTQTGSLHSTQIGTNGTGAGTQVQGINSNLLGIADNGVTWEFALDTTGNAGFRGNVTATQFFSTSLRNHKQDIRPLSLDALQVLHDTDWATYRYRPQWGDPKQTHIGFIADDTPSILSGEKHDHFDAGSLATVDAQAILQLQTQLKVAVCTLGALIVVLLVGLVGVAFIRATD